MNDSTAPSQSVDTRVDELRRMLRGAWAGYPDGARDAYERTVDALLEAVRREQDGDHHQVGSREYEWEERANRVAARAERYARELTVLERVRDTGLLAATKVIAPNMPAWRAFTDALADAEQTEPSR